MPCRRIIASAAEPRGGRRVRGRAERTTFFTASNASAEAVVEGAVAAGAFPSDAEAEEASSGTFRKKISRRAIGRTRALRATKN